MRSTRKGSNCFSTITRGTPVAASRATRTRANARQDVGNSAANSGSQTAAAITSWFPPARRMHAEVRATSTGVGLPGG